MASCLICFRNFVIYNPTTREYIELPGPDVVNQAELSYRFGYEYQAELFYGFGYESFCGFGYDSQSDDYKIVAADVSSDENWKVANIFSQVRFLEKDTNDLRKDVIMSFDLSEEKFHQVFPVPEVDEEIDFLGLGIHGANLFIYHSTYYFIEAWLIDEYSRGALWTKFFRVDCSPFINWNNTPIPRKPIAYTRSGKIVFHMDMNLMILFNPEDNSHKDYPMEEDSEYAMYLETLVSPYLRGEPSRI
ncbi:uncharacterized protein LOC120287227 [Eucalyptus grandis]|uniref:uncharacterized protein LOC120287227 n=1 Tax=Eucalyptus grandis TaxID=71139 RepID=UPI00192E8273|nr:uncharacterized protein LOC120287227 [Eucalyptus grandis]